MSEWDKFGPGHGIRRLLDEERARRKHFEDPFGSLAIQNYRTDAERMLDAAESALAGISNVKTSHDQLQDLLKNIVPPKTDGLTKLISDIHSQADRMASISAAAEALYSRTDWARFQASTFTTPDLASRLESTYSQLTLNYRTLVDSLAEGQLYTISPNVSALSPVEVFLAGDLAYLLSPSDSEEAEHDLAEDVRNNVIPAELPELGILLSEVDPNLLIMLDGARHALSRDNPERVRHVTTTLREIFTQVLHHLSPESELIAWSTEPENFSNGRPTRRARLLFIVRHIESKQLSTFLESDVKAALAFLDAFHAGTHGPPGNFTDQQLRAMLVRMEGLLRFLLEVKRGRGNGGD
ncbi:MAG: hypothetical protein QOH06_3158 [Acidobacteriota bacterium]|jgi:hypothetical protein|nr:hypothetical protein [Acidobacteriota bacterium]